MFSKSYDDTVEIFISFLNAPNWNEAKRILSENINLLCSTMASRVFIDLLQQYSKDEQAVHDLNVHWKIIQQSCKEGVDVAFSPYLGQTFNSKINQAIDEFLYLPNNWQQACEAFLRWQDVLMSQEALYAIDHHLRTALEVGSESFVRQVKTSRSLLETAIEHGIQSAVEDFKLLELADSLGSEVLKKIKTALEAQSDEEMAKIIDEHPEAWDYIKAIYSKGDPDWAMTIEPIEEILSKIEQLRHPHEMPVRIDLCKQAIRLLESHQKTNLWAQFQGQLANSYAQSSLGNRADNIEKALEHYQKALEVYTPDDYPRLWATTHYNIGTTYNKRIIGDRYDNIEWAIYHHEQALSIITRENNREIWADIQHALGNNYLDRLDGSHKKNLSKALQHFNAAYEVYKFSPDSEDWARVNASLGQAYTQVGDDLQKALSYLTVALKAYTYESNPFDWALTHNQISLAYNHLGDYDDLKKANLHLLKALKAYTRELYPREFAGIQANLGYNYSELSMHNHYFFQDAIEHLQLAVEVRQDMHLYRDLRVSAIALGDLYFFLQEWREAYTAYEKGIEADDRILADSYTNLGQRSEIGKSAQLYTNASYCLLKIGNYHEALQLFERGKARLLTRVLVLGEALLKMSARDERDTFERLAGTIKKLNIELQSPVNTPSRRSDRELSILLQRAYAEQKTLIEQIRSQHPEIIPSDLDVYEILTLVPKNSAIVAPLVTKHGTAVFIIPANTLVINSDHVLWLEDFTINSLQYFRRHWQNKYQNPWTFRELFQETMEKLWESLIGPIKQQLTSYNVEHVIFIPQGGLQMFPLHAAWHIHGGQKRFFLDYYSVSYSPSFYSLKIAQKRAGSRKLNGAFVAGVENYHSKPLTYARQEAETVARILNTIALINEEVSKESVIRSVTGKTYLHFVCHGSFPWKNDVFTSALHLSDKESLTLVEIIGELDLSEARLVILSACESGFVDTFVPDEALGLPVGFLQAGAAGSISTLWPIDDQSTSLLMESFYNKLIKVNRSPAQALREAQIELRAVTWDRLKKYYASNESEAGIQAYIEATLKKPDDRPYEDPYYWAAFTFNGA